MQEQTEKHISPFCFYEGMELSFDNKVGGSGQSLLSLIERKLLSPYETAVIELLVKYGVLNAYLLQRALSGLYDASSFNTSFCSKLLRKLQEYGFVTRFRLSRKDALGVPHFSTPFYALSEKGRSIFGKNTIPLSYKVPDILSRMACNQFFITVGCRIGYALKNAFYGFSGASDGYIQVRCGDKVASFNIISIRNHKSASSEFVKRLKVIANSVDSIIASGCYIVLVESETQALELERYRCSVADVASFEVFYLCDHASFTEEIFTNLISVIPEGYYTSYTICSLPVSREKEQGEHIETEKGKNLSSP